MELLIVKGLNVVGTIDRSYYSYTTGKDCFRVGVLSSATRVPGWMSRINREIKAKGLFLTTQKELSLLQAMEEIFSSVSSTDGEAFLALSKYCW